jgi:hypothetical protein
MEKNGIDVDYLHIHVNDQYRFVELFYNCFPAKIVPFRLTVALDVPVQNRNGNGTRKVKGIYLGQKAVPPEYPGECGQPYTEEKNDAVVPVSPAFADKFQTYSHRDNKVKAEIIRKIDNVQGTDLQKDQSVHISRRKIGHFPYIEMGKGFQGDNQGNKDRNNKEGVEKSRLSDIEPNVFKAEQQGKSPQAGSGKIFDPGDSPGGFLGMRVNFQKITDGVYSNHEDQAAQVLHVGLSPFKQKTKQKVNTNENVNSCYYL